MNNSKIQLFWKNISTGKTPGTISVSDEFWTMFKPEDKVLEVGCAWGRIVFECLKRDLKVVGIDINNNETDLLKKKLAEQNISKEFARVLESDILSTNFKDNQFQGAILLGVLAGLSENNRKKCMKEVWRILTPRGLVHIGEFELNTNDPSYLKRYKTDLKCTGEYGTLSVKDEDGKELYQSHNFSVDEITNLITKNGFVIEKFIKDTFTSYHGHKKPGMMIIARKVI